MSVVVDSLFIVTPNVGVCNCCMFCCTLLYVHSCFENILMGKRERERESCLSHDYCVALPRGVIFSAVCDCGIS